MPRKPRFHLPGFPQHIIQRGNNREPSFYTKADYYRYLDNLGAALQRNSCNLHAYVLMTNHVHLLITPQEKYGISRVMQDVGRKFVRHMNASYQRSGTLWEGRYKASLVDSEAYLLTCMRYIEMNPVRAGMVLHPGEYRWSSYAANGGGKTDPIITPHALYHALGDNLPGCRFAYRELFRNHMKDIELHMLRDALNQELVLGRESFKDKLEKMTERQIRRGRDGRPRTEDSRSVYRVMNDEVGI